MCLLLDAIYNPNNEELEKVFMLECLNVDMVISILSSELNLQASTGHFCGLADN